LPRRHHRTGSATAGRLFVDSSGWIALVSARDQHHAEAHERFEAAAAQRRRLITTNLVLAETHRLLLFRAGPQAARRVLDRLEASTLLTIEFATAAHHRAALAWLDRLPDQRISYTDAVSFAVMEATACPTAIGFDGDFVVAGFSLWRPAD